MGRKRKAYSRPTAPCAVDDTFMRSAAKSLEVGALPENAQCLIASSIRLRNAACRLRAEDKSDSAPRRGRPLNLGEHVFVDGMLDILESEVGIDARTSKSYRHVKGRVSDFLRVIWNALEHPDRSADGFARLAANCSSVLGKTADERQERRAKRRAPRLAYDERIKNAWKR